MQLNNGGGSYPCNIDTIFTVFTISFKSAITLLFRYACPYQEQPLVPRPHCFLTHELTVLLLIFRRFACHSQHPQGSWHLRCLVFLWQYRAVVHWNRGLPSVSEPTQITLLSLLFELSSCARFTRAVLLVWDVARHGLSTPFLKTCLFLFRYSFCHTSNLYPLPFSATTQVITNNTRHTFNYPMRQLYFVCKRCWTYSRHVSTLHEPCWGCYIIESSGWEFWNTQQREVYILIFFVIVLPFFIHQPGDDQSHEE